MEEFIEEFRHEAHELINSLEHNLVEHNISATKEIQEENFRCLHSIKGAAGMFGYTKVEEITHILETIYDDIRDDIIPLSQSIVEVSLKSVDVIRQLVDNNENIDEALYKQVLQEIQQLKGAVVHEEGSTAQETGTNSLFYIQFTPEPIIFERGVNPFSALEEIEEVGKNLIIEINESGKTHKEQEDTKKLESSWEIFVHSPKGLEEVEDVFLFFEEEEYVIMPVTDTFFDDAAIAERFEQRTKKQLQDLKQDILDLVDASVEVVEENIVVEESEIITDADEEQPVEKEETVSSQQSKTDGAFIKVSSEKLDVMLNLVSDLVTTFSEIKLKTDQVNDPKLNNSIKKLEKLSKNFRDNALEIRLVSIKALFQQMKRLVFDLSNKLNKPVNFISDGLDTELDKTVIKALENPLMHILRNSIDHGLEPEEERIAKHKDPKGLLKFVSYYSGSYVIIQIQDDGKGIDIEKVRQKAIHKGLISENDHLTENETLSLIFEPGFSTADEISKVSGRGVGMDVVKKELAKIRAEVTITTEKDLGTSVTLKLPVTLSIVDTLLVSVGEVLFLLPLSEVEFCFKEETRVIYARESQQVVFENELVPFIRLRSTLKIAGEAPEEERVIIVNRNGQRTAIICDVIIDEHQAVIKPLGPLFNDQEYFSGGSILGDGRLAIILDTGKLIEKESRLKFKHQ